MSFAICCCSCAPMYGTPSAKTPLVSELLFGEPFEILKTGPHYFKICTGIDRYEGWVDKQLVVEVEKNEFDRLCLGQPEAVRDLAAWGRSRSRDLLLPRGALLPVLSDGSFMLRDETFVYEGSAAGKGGADAAALFDYLCRSYMSCPYRWGGRSPWGLDCSGFVQVLFRLLGISLPRDTGDQVKTGEHVPDPSAVQSGDLIFGRNVDTGDRHVGIIKADGAVVHCSSQVREDLLVEEGIYNSEQRRLTYTLEEIRRVLPAGLFSA